MKKLKTGTRHKETWQMMKHSRTELGYPKKKQFEELTLKTEELQEL